MKKAWDFKQGHTFTVGSKIYDAHAAIRYANDQLEPFELVIDHMYLEYASPCTNSLKDFARHMLQCQDADLSKPIILNEDGVVIDGKHRIIKALTEGKKTILAVKFPEDPAEIFTWEG